MRVEAKIYCDNGETIIVDMGSGCTSLDLGCPYCERPFALTDDIRQVQQQVEEHRKHSLACSAR